MDINEAKIIIDNQLEKAIYANIDILDNVHPMRVIQALKSLIGIDIDNPSEKLIHWGEEYLNNIDTLSKDHFKYSINKPKETIVLSDLGNHILSNKYDKSIDELQDLCSVSDGNQIFEYLIEFSCIHKMSAIPFIWSALRTNIFMKNKFTYPLLLLSVKGLFDNRFFNDGFFADIDIGCASQSIKYSSLTRRDKINTCLEEGLFKYNNISGVKMDDLDMPENKDRSIILDYLNHLKTDEITKELILILDGCRMVLKDSPLNVQGNALKIINLLIESKSYVNATR